MHPQQPSRRYLKAPHPAVVAAFLLSIVLIITTVHHLIPMAVAG
jgi:hypothetical protein